MYPPVDFRNRVAAYHQKGDTWCGPTNIQMARNGYPKPAERKLYKQLDLVHLVEHNNTTEGWHCDPQGLYRTINALDNPAGVNWTETVEDDRRPLLLNILIRMDQTGFPVPVLVKKGIHWVLIVSFRTDDARSQRYSP
jgi:hypothetical protein